MDVKDLFKKIEDYENKDVVLEVLKTEKIKFGRTLEKGLKEFEKMTSNLSEK